MDLAAIRRAAEGATKGPWAAEHRRNGEARIRMASDPTNARGAIAVLDFGKRAEVKADADYIALLDPATILALVAVVEAAQAVDRLYSEPPNARDGDSRAQAIAEGVVALHKALTVTSPTDRGRGGR